MQTALECAEIVGGFYAFVAAWIGLSILGSRIADQLERRGHRA